MTGRELIIYILSNNLENEKILDDDLIFGLINEEEAAAKLGVGPSTIKVWYLRNMVDGIKIGDSIYFLKSIRDPRTVMNKKSEEKNT